jgi:hypothetical protein
MGLLSRTPYVRQAHTSSSQDQLPGNATRWAGSVTLRDDARRELRAGTTDADGASCCNGLH